MRRLRVKKAVSFCIILLFIPGLILAGALLFSQEQYAVFSLLVAFAACIPFFLAFERKQPKARESILIAVMVALSVAGRILFAALPGFKPVTALVVITALHFGPEAGFLTGALSALLSNIYFGQGPWTPFQMLVWGLIGFVAGLLARPLKKHLVLLLLYGVVAGAAFSLIMDIWTVLSFGEGWRWDRYGLALLSALPFTAVYAASNVIFLLLPGIPLNHVLERIKKRYGLREYYAKQ